MRTMSTSEFLDVLAAGEPTPGGGGAAALTGSQAAALVSMVINFTVGKKKYAAVEEEMRGYLAQSETLRRELLAGRRRRGRLRRRGRHLQAAQGERRREGCPHRRHAGRAQTRRRRALCRGGDSAWRSCAWPHRWAPRATATWSAMRRRRSIWPLPRIQERGRQRQHQPQVRSRMRAFVAEWTRRSQRFAPQMPTPPMPRRNRHRRQRWGWRYDRADARRQGAGQAPARGAQRALRRLYRSPRLAPTLAVLRIGDDEASAGYARAIEKTCQGVGAGFRMWSCRLGAPAGGRSRARRC
jgi:hypothetical protein